MLSVPISAVNAPDMSVSVCPGIVPLAFDQADDTSDTAVVCVSSRSTSLKLSVPDVASGVDEPVVLVSSGTVTISAEDVITGRSLVPVTVMTPVYRNRSYVHLHNTLDFIGHRQCFALA